MASRAALKNAAGWNRKLGVDCAIDYKSDNVAAELAKIDGGINAYFDNVAGPILDAVLPNMALYGRIALCGLMAQYSGDGRAWGHRISIRY